jgi:hypothetical protein
MVWLLLSWLAVGVVVAVGFGMLARRRKRRATRSHPPKLPWRRTVDEHSDLATPGREDRAAA